MREIRYFSLLIFIAAPQAQGGRQREGSLLALKCFPILNESSLVELGLIAFCLQSIFDPFSVQG